VARVRKDVAAADAGIIVAVHTAQPRERGGAVVEAGVQDDDPYSCSGPAIRRDGRVGCRPGRDGDGFVGRATAAGARDVYQEFGRSGVVAVCTPDDA
jgi:hypothetical protein